MDRGLRGGAQWEEATGAEGGAPGLPARPYGLHSEIGQGQLATSDRPGTRLVATLGSCVAVCLHDRRHARGGMTHIYRCVDPGPMGGAEVVAEVERLVNALMRLGAVRSQLRARLAGGARTLVRGRDHGGAIARVCITYLVAEGIPLLQRDLGGSHARRVMFDPVLDTLRVTFPGVAPQRSAAPPRCTGEGPELF